MDTSKTMMKGHFYEATDFEFAGWNEGDGTSTDGYNAWAYFSKDGEYLGPDEHGIEPLFVVKN